MGWSLIHPTEKSRNLDVFVVQHSTGRDALKSPSRLLVSVGNRLPNETGHPSYYAI
jgi:hypothetical protein